MQIIITVSKTELDKYHGLASLLSSWSFQISELENAVVYRPKDGLLILFINFLNQKGVSFTVGKDDTKPD